MTRTPIKKEISLDITPNSKRKLSKQARNIPELNDLVPKTPISTQVTPNKRVLEKSPISHRRSMGAISPYRSASNLNYRFETTPKKHQTPAKQKMLNYLISLQILQKNSTANDIIDNMKTGWLLCDLINRLEGRNEPIKGIQRNIKTVSASLFNINKGLEYLRSIPKMSPCYLWASEEIFSGDETAIFGILNDIKLLYSGKPLVAHNNQPVEMPEKSVTTPKSLEKRGYSRQKSEISFESINKPKSPKLIKVTDEMKNKITE